MKIHPMKVKANKKIFWSIIKELQSSRVILMKLVSQLKEESRKNKMTMKDLNNLMSFLKH